MDKNLQFIHSVFESGTIEILVNGCIYFWHDRSDVVDCWFSGLRVSLSTPPHMLLNKKHDSENRKGIPWNSWQIGLAGSLCNFNVVIGHFAKSSAAWCGQTDSDLTMINDWIDVVVEQYVCVCVVGFSFWKQIRNGCWIIVRLLFWHPLIDVCCFQVFRTSNLFFCMKIRMLCISVQMDEAPNRMA